MNNNEKLYEKFLDIDCPKSKKNYLDFKRIKEYLKVENIFDSNYEQNIPDWIEEIKNTDFDEKGNRQYSNALSKYQKFLELKNIFIPSKKNLEEDFRNYLRTQFDERKTTIDTYIRVLKKPTTIKAVNEVTNNNFSSVFSFNIRLSGEKIEKCVQKFAEYKTKEEEYYIKNIPAAFKQYTTFLDTLEATTSNFPTCFLQSIYFGTPGSGKSYKVNEIVNGQNCTRVTFHPDTDYAAFVGSYKPTKKGNALTYEFVPQAFTNAYVAAWKNTETPYYLVIEEINRGNCSQIFGDLFQLLDREYSIKAATDLGVFLKKELGKENYGIKDDNLKLPQNLHILATMNTSDQSLFPIDSAFKRRWAWEYVPIDYENEVSKTFEITVAETKYGWHDFLKTVNEQIKTVTDSEDKQMGNFFIKASVDESEFKNKVMFYLWSEICKEEYGTQNNFFRYNNHNEEKEFSFNDLYSNSNGTDILQKFFEYLGIKPAENIE
ncbi:hypothetical protein AGMMS49965_07140 [Bacteroidia bacterium]|nr:hypothetical protein AGMMS49965_07140 [Bacteroidia bacterium]